MDAALAALRAKVIAAVPVERNFRSTAVRYVDDMQKATKIFDATTIDFAQEMIRDTHEYNPQTVAELLAFLRKYRLFFASAEGRAQDGDVYRTLFGLMRDQKQKLGLSLLPPELVAANEAAKEAAQFEGRWVLVRTVRDGKVTPAPKNRPRNRSSRSTGLATRWAPGNPCGIRGPGRSIRRRCPRYSTASA